MIVSYEDVGNWVDGIKSTDKDKFIFVIFVLNSSNTLSEKEVDYSLEEYIRKSEMADHTSWSDFSIGNFNPRIVSKIQSQVDSKISKEFSVDDEMPAEKFNSGLGKLFGDLLLPPENFGKKPNCAPGQSKKSGLKLSKHKNVILECNTANVIYYAGGMTINLIIKAKRKIKSTGFTVAIESETGTISHNDWENKLGLSMPFEVVGADIKINIKGGTNGIVEISVDEEKIEMDRKNIRCVLHKSNKGKGYGVHIDFSEMVVVEMEIAVHLKLYRRDIKPVFLVEKDGVL